MCVDAALAKVIRIEVISPKCVGRGEAGLATEKPGSLLQARFSITLNGGSNGIQR